MSCCIDRYQTSLFISDKKASEAYYEDKISRLVNFLLMKQSSLEGLVDSKLIKSVLSSCDRDLKKGFSLSLQKALLAIDLDHVGLKEELFISSVISLIPYSYPQKGDEFRLPVKSKKGRFYLKTFSVETIIDMNQASCLTPLKAYGLKSSTKESLLIFTGTTFPAGEGFWNAVMADFSPFNSVGALAFKKGFSQLTRYFEDHGGVRLYGMSLGGALALHTLRHFEPRIREVYASVPAGLHFFDKFRPECDKKVVITMQKGDIVTDLGYFPEHPQVEIYSLKLTSSRPLGLHAHAKVFSGSSEVKISKMDPKSLNRSLWRRILSVAHLAFGWIIFGILCLGLVLYQIKSTLIPSYQPLTSLFQRNLNSS